MIKIISQNKIEETKWISYLMIISLIVFVIVFGGTLKLDKVPLTNAILYSPFLIYYFYIGINYHYFFLRKSSLYLYKHQICIKEKADYLIKKEDLEEIEITTHGKQVFMVIKLNNGENLTFEVVEYHYLIRITNLIPRYYVYKMIYYFKEYGFYNMINRTSIEKVKKDFWIAYP